MVHSHAVGKSSLIYRSISEIPHTTVTSHYSLINTRILQLQIYLAVILRGQHSTTQQDKGAEGDECFPAIVVISYCSHSAIIM